MLWIGVGLALLAACTHSAIDVLRKFGSSTLPPTALVALPALLDAIISCFTVAALGGFQGLQFLQPGLFTVAVASSSALLLASKLLYQKALSSSPLSLTIPYLSFTPAFLVITAYVLVGEAPSTLGLTGVLVVTFGGYLLSIKNSTAPAPNSRVLAAASEHRGKSPSYQSLADLESGLERKKSSFRNHSRQSSSTDLLQAVFFPGGKAVLPAAAAKQDEAAAWAPPELRSLAPLKALVQEPGTVMMLGVAAVWSMTASLDKLGIMHAPSIWVYFALQRLCIGAASAVYLLSTSPSTFKHLFSRFWMLLAISLLELLAVVLFLEAIKYIYVTYVVAIKRCNILISVLLGSLLFKESVLSKLPYIFLMGAGMWLILLDSNASDVHHTTHA